MEKRFCPNCGSDWVEPDTENAAAIYFHGGNPNQWKCNKCNYTGFMPAGDPEENKEIDFEEKDKYPQIDTKFGRGYLKYLIYIVLPFTILYLIYLVLM